MAQQRIAQIEDQLGDIRKEMQEIAKTMGKLQSEATDAGKGIKSMGKATDSLAKGFKGVGLAIKSAGIGLLISAFQTLKDLFSQNENVSAAFAAGMQFITSIFNDLVDLITVHVVPAFKAVFDDPKQALADFGTLIKNNLIERFNSFLEVIESVGYGLSRLFAGDFAGFVDAAKNAGKEMVDVVTGVDDTLGKVAEVAGKVGDAMSASFKKAADQTKQAFNLSKLTADIEIARANMEKLRFTMMRDAEIQRQIRDDQTKSIKERMDANTELGHILNEQAQKEQEFLKLELGAARTRANLNKQDRSLQAEVIRIETEMLDIQERITGQLSEQLTNQVGLRQEQLAMQQSITNAEMEAQRIALEGEAAREVNLLRRLELEKRVAEETYQAQKAALEAIYNDQTIAQADRMQAVADLMVLEAQHDQTRLNNERTLADARRGIAENLFGALNGIAEEGTDMAKGLAVAQATWNTYQAITAALGAQPYGPWNIAQAVATGLFGFAQVRKILETNPQDGGGSVDSSVSGPTPPPLPNIAVAQGINNPNSQIEATVNAPVRAYVVSREVTTGQSLDRNTIKNATLAPG
jgi:hypothetical protein